MNTWPYDMSVWRLILAQMITRATSVILQSEISSQLTSIFKSTWKFSEITSVPRQKSHIKDKRPSYHADAKATKNDSPMNVVHYSLSSDYLKRVTELEAVK